jgi:probable rRNA maturation factor
MIDLSDEKFRIEIANRQSKPFESERLIFAVRMILSDYGVLETEFSIAIVDDPTIRELNNTYLGHDYETDVISFVLEEDSERSFLSGQLIVSIDTAETVAASIGVKPEDELLLYVVHGTLHLVGLDDKQPELAQEMRAAEKEYLERMNVPYRWPSDNEDDSRDGWVDDGAAS